MRPIYLPHNKGYSEFRKSAVTSGDIKYAPGMKWVVLLNLSKFKLLKPSGSKEGEARRR